MNRIAESYRDREELCEEQREVRQLECRVCNESYLSDTERVPRLLDCGHTVCQICVQRLFSLSVNDSSEVGTDQPEATFRLIHCPFCRTPMRLASAAHLRRNYALNDLIESDREHRGKFRKQSQRASESDSVVNASGTMISQSNVLQTDTVDRDVRCDEDDAHSAVEYCTVCRTHLCGECAIRTHATRTLQRHKRVPLSEKVAAFYFDYARCALHSQHALELICIEPTCIVPYCNAHITGIGSPSIVSDDSAFNQPVLSAAAAGSSMNTVRFACYACIEAGPHRGHAYRTVEDEAAVLRRAVRDVQRNLTTLLREITELDRQIRATQQRIGGERRDYGADNDSIGSAGTRGGELAHGGSSGSDSQSQVAFAQHEQLRVAAGAETAGTAEQTRAIIASYFQAQFRRLKEQQDEALITFDAHIRERLLKLTVQRNELERMIAQVQATYMRSERLVCQHNARVCIAKGEITTILSDCQALRRAFAERADRACTTRLLDARMPITFTKDNRLHIGTRIEIRVCILGLDGAGKTSILHRLKQNEFIPGVAPTIGFNVDTIEYANAFRAVHSTALFTGGVQYQAVSATRVRSASDTQGQEDARSGALTAFNPNRAVASNVCFTLWDMSGMHKVRTLWKYYYANTHAIIYVVDSADRARLCESAAELHRLMHEPSLRSTALLIMANKQDLLHVASADSPMESSNDGGNAGAAHWSVEELLSELGLNNLVSMHRSWCVQPCSALTGLGVADALEWIAQQFVVADANDGARVRSSHNRMAQPSAVDAVEAQQMMPQSQSNAQAQSPLETAIFSDQSSITSASHSRIASLILDNLG